MNDDRTVSALEHQLAVLDSRARVAEAEALVLATATAHMPRPLPAPVQAMVQRVADELAEVRRFAEAAGTRLRAIREG